MIVAAEDKSGRAVCSGSLSHSTAIVDRPPCWHVAANEVQSPRWIPLLQEPPQRHGRDLHTRIDGPAPQKPSQLLAC